MFVWQRPEETPHHHEFTRYLVVFEFHLVISATVWTCRLHFVSGLIDSFQSRSHQHNACVTLHIYRNTENDVHIVYKSEEMSVLCSQISPAWLTHVFTGSARDSGCMTTQRWWLLWGTVRSSTRSSSWTQTSTTTPVLASTAGGSSLEPSKTWTAASGSSTPGRRAGTALGNTILIAIFRSCLQL